MATDFKQLENGKVTFSGVRLTYTDFKGQVDDNYNVNGARTFYIYVDDELGRELAEQGWNVKFPKPTDHIDPENDKRTPRVRIVLSDGPEVKHWVRVFTVTGDIARPVDINNPKALANLDNMFFSHADLVVKPTEWVRFEGTAREARGVKAYVNILYLHIASSIGFDDPFASRYEQAPIDDDAMPF